MAEIWARDIRYSLLRIYVDWCTRRSYTGIKVEGKYPKDGRAVIIAPNHSSALMDALVVLQSDKDPSVYGTRSDVFNNPVIARIFRVLKMVPIARRTEGLRAVAQNLDVIPEIVDVLHHNVPFCLFAEGYSRSMHSLQHLHKGVARIALRNAATQPTCIVPVGIDYSEFFRYRGKCLMKIGEPIDVNEWISEHPGLHDSASATKLSQHLSERIKELILYIPDDENYGQRLLELRPPKKRRWWEWPLAVLTAPFFLLSAFLTLPQWAISRWICRNKITDRGFHNSVRFFLRFAGAPVMIIIWAVLGFVFLPPLAACGLLLYYCLSYSIFYDWLNLVRIEY